MGMHRIILTIMAVYIVVVHVLLIFNWVTISEFTAQSLRIRVVSQAQSLLMADICILGY